MPEHKLKTWPEYWEAINANNLLGCSRRDDRGYQVGDVLILCEWDGHYTGRECRRVVSYVLRGDQFGIAAGYVVLSMAPMPAQGEVRR